MTSVSTKNYNVYFYGYWCPDWISYEYYVSRLSLLRKGLSLEQAKKYIEICTDTASLLTHSDHRYTKERDGKKLGNWTENINHNARYGIYFYTLTPPKDFVTFGVCEGGIRLHYPLGPLPKDVVSQINDSFTDLETKKKELTDVHLEWEAKHTHIAKIQYQIEPYSVCKSNETIINHTQEKGFDYGVYELTPIEGDDCTIDRFIKKYKYVPGDGEKGIVTGLAHYGKLCCQSKTFDTILYEGLKETLVQVLMITY